MIRQSPLLVRNTRWRAGLWLGCLSAVALLLLWRGDLFAQFRLRLSDLYFAPASNPGSVVIVAIDDASLEAYGRVLTEWPRALYAELLNQVSTARVVGFDLLFDVPKSGDETLAAAIRQARAGEARTRAIMPIVGVERVLGSSRMARFQDAMRPNPILAAAADYLGSVNTFQDIDGVIRRQPAFVQVGDEETLSFSLAIYLAYLRIPAAAIHQVVYPAGDMLNVTPQRQLYLDEGGLWQQNFFMTPATVSFRDVLSGQVDPAVFADRIVLVGLMNASGFIDQYPVPTDTGGNLMAGVEIHAHAIESLIQNQLPRPVNPTFWIIGLSIFASLLYVYARWYLLIPLSLLLVAALALTAFYIFHQRQEMIDLFYTGLALITPLVLHSGRKLSLEIDRRRRSEFLLQSVVEISNQRLVLERILPRIAADIRRVLSSPAGAIWLIDDESSRPRLAHQWPESAAYVPMLESICRRSRAEGRAVISYPCVAVPVHWQGRLLAVLTAQIPLRWHPPRAALYLLQSLADQLAPSLENAILYTEVARQKATLETILDTSPTGIALLGSDLRPIRCNAAYEAALSDSAILSEKFQAGAAFREEVQIGKRSYNLEAAPLAGFQQWVVILNDVTTLSELNRFKTQMIRMASHDLRNPLARILGYADLVQQINGDSLPEQSRRFLGSIQTAAEQMNEIIGGILDLELVRAGGVRHEPLDLREVVREAIRHQQTDMERRQQIFEAEIPDSPACVLGNYRQLAQVATNLLGNAVKYTPDAGHIHLRLYQQDDALVRLEIEDTGYGISEEAQKQLFTEFYRVRTPATADIPGSGLGLSLVKSVVDSHNGRVWVSSQEGVGSTFFVELPLLKDENDA